MFIFSSLRLAHLFHLAPDSLNLEQIMTSYCDEDEVTASDLEKICLVSWVSCQYVRTSKGRRGEEACKVQPWVCLQFPSSDCTQRHKRKETSESEGSQTSGFCSFPSRDRACQPPKHMTLWESLIWMLPRRLTWLTRKPQTFCLPL